MSHLIKIKNTSGSVNTYAGKEFAIDEEYTIPTDGNRIKWQTHTTVLAAIASGNVMIGDGSEYFTDINQALDWLKGNITLPSDIDGVPLSRTKITKTGWHFQAQTLELITSKLDSVYNKDSDGNDLGFTSIKYYNANNDELIAPNQGTLDTDCVKTVITWEPTYDYEIIGGTLYQSTIPANDVRLWIIAVPDLTVEQGGSVPFAEGGLNLKHMGTGAIMELDGKSPKLMSYNNTYHTNKFQLIVKHSVGDQNPLMLVFKIFEE